jgi:hypothetical protein
MNRHKLLFMLLILGLGLCSGLFAQVNITIGEGTTTNITTGAPTPYGTYFKNFRQQYLYTATDIENAGGGAGPINSLAFNVQAVNTISPMPNFSIKIKQTQQSVLTTTFEVGEYTEVFFENDFLPVNGLNVHSFIAPFTWDGSSNILVDILTSMIPGDYTQNASVYFTATTGINTSLRYQNDTLPAADATTGTVSVDRANVTFNMSGVQITNPPNPANLLSPADGSTLATMATTLSWSSGGGLPTGYKLYMGTTNPPAFVEDLGSVTSYNTPNLEFSSTYYWQVVPYNDNGDATDCPVWTFTSMEDPIVYNLPWLEGFETGNTDNAAIAGWMQEGIAGTNIWTANTSQTNYNRTPRTGAWNAFLRYGNTRWMFKALSLEAGTDYRVNMYARQDGATAANASIGISFGSEPSAAGMTNTILESTSIINGDYQMLEGIFSVPESGVYYVGILGTITSSPWYISVDDITIEQVSADPNLIVNPTTWNFGQNLVNTSAQKSFTIANNGGGTLNVSTVSVDGQYYSLAEAFSPVSLNAGETASFVVQYAPTIAGNHTGNATVTAGAQQVEITLSGSCYDPIISTFPWTEDFGTVAADWPVMNWTQLNGLYPDPTGTTAQWFQDDWLNVAADNKAAKINIYGSSRNGWLITPPVNVPAGSFQLSFDAALMTWNQTTPPTTTQEDDRFMVIVSDSPEMSNPTILREWNNTGSEHVFNDIPADGMNYSITLAGLTGIKYFAFYGESTVSGNGDNDLMIDNITISEGTTPENPIFAINPASHNFGEVNLGETVSQTFTITNTGSGILGITSIAINSAMMSVPNPGLPFNLSAGHSASVVVVYAPTAAGDHSTTMVITDNLSRVAHNISLGGIGVQTATDLYPPTNLQAAIQANDVHLSWNAPEPPPTGEWITWCDTADLGNGIGTNGAATFDIAHRYDAADLAGFQGSTLTHMQFVPNETLSTYTVKIWTGGTATAPGSMIHSQLVNAPVIGSWNTVELTTPIPIPTTGQLWIGVGIVAQAGYPAGCDDGPQVEGKGNMMYINNAWTTLSQVSATPLTYNWSIQGYVDHEFRALAYTPQAIEETTLTFAEGTFAKSGSNRSITREHTGYKVYRDGALVGTVTDIETLTFVDSALELGSYDYHVTAAYTAGESLPTNTVTVTIEDLAPPADLAATVEGNNVNLNWTSPVPPLEGVWISWSNNDLIDNSIGTDGVANFDVAHRYDANDILPHVGGTLAMVKFTPMYANAVYTVKIWTGGTATAPGTLVHSQVVSNPTIQDWTTVILTNPVLITGDQLWFGYNVNTQGGYPAGCDTGPQVEGKGNMMYINNAWTTLSQVSATPLTYNWQLQGLVVQGGTYKAIAHRPIVESAQPSTTGSLKNARIDSAKTNSRAVLLGYKVYRDGALISSINDPAVTTFTNNSMPNADYVYGVTAVYNNGESAAATVDVTVNLEIAPVVFEDSFETYDDFAMAMAPWTLLDQDGSGTYGFEGITFPNSESAMAYIVFNPSATVPPITGMDPYEGNKMAASFAAVNGPNSDWMITPRINLGANSSLKFYAKSHTAQYGLERFRVGVSTAPAIYPQLFTYITGTSHVEAPTSWTEYHYDLSSYDNQSAFIGIRCVSDDAFVFYVDNVSVHSGASSNDDNSAPVVKTELKGNYPNPFNPETTIRYSVKENAPVTIEIYNLKGQLVKRLVNSDKAAGEHSVVWNGTDANNRPVSSGVYFYKMNAGKYSSSKKMIMMK